jgi:dTDP-4-amino-4,6-dideoxygalactose transaminase
LDLPPKADPETRHAYHLYTILVDKTKTGIGRDTFLQSMTDLNIGVAVHYLSIPEHPFYRKKFGWKLTDYPHVKRIGRHTVSLPLSAKLAQQDVDDVIEAVTRVLKP